MKDDTVRRHLLRIRLSGGCLLVLALLVCGLFFGVVALVKFAIWGA